MSRVALDTSVAVPYVVASDVAHDLASRHLAAPTVGSRNSADFTRFAAVRVLDPWAAAVS